MCIRDSGMNALKVRDGLSGRALHHEKDTEVVVPLLISRIKTHSRAELFLSKVRPPLSYICLLYTSRCV